MKDIKKFLPDLLVVALFVIISVAYFTPSTFEGRILYQHDTAAGVGAGSEVSAYKSETGETTRWTNALFGGMPTYQIAPSYGSLHILAKVADAFHLWLPDYVWQVFMYLLGFYILLRAFDFRRELAVLGAIVWAFSSYFFIIIAAGHMWKVMALAYLPPMIAGVVWSYKGRYGLGFMVTALFTALEIMSNHVQMTYYYLFILLCLFVGWLVQAVRRHTLPAFFKSTVVAFLGVMLGVAINGSNLYHTYQYTQESMRGKSELVKKQRGNQTGSGLDRDYITQWSYGIDETWTLLVPNVKGGASEPMINNRAAMEKADPQFMSIYQQLGQYWGEQPMTKGPVYVGAFVLMLFFFALFTVKGPVKWALLVATVLSVLLSWGRNFMPFTDFFIDYVPMYAKFRTVSSILVIAEFTIPLLAMLGLKQVMDDREVLGRNMKWLWVSFALTGGMALLFYLMPTLFFPNYISTQEEQALAQIPAEYLGPLRNNIIAVRQYIFTQDALRSFIVVLVGTLFLLAYKLKKIDVRYVVAGITVLCLADMWAVNKRYLNDGMFVEKSVRSTSNPMTETDKQILRDKDPNYRVLNLASNTFNENETSLYHKSIGGYHAAKLRRYQELIDAYIQPEMQGLMKHLSEAGGDMTKVNGDAVFPILNMLNTKYFIVPLQNNQTVPVQNPYTAGNAWYVDKLTYVGNANGELDGLKGLDVKHAAVADAKYREVLGQAVPQGNVSLVKLQSYAPNHLVYEANSDKGGVIVFSEIFYPGWSVTVDGRPAELGRVNYVLRALRVDKGKHEIVLDFHPQSIRITETIAYVTEVFLVLLFGFGLWMNGRKKKRNA